MYYTKWFKHAKLVSKSVSWCLRKATFQRVAASAHSKTLLHLDVLCLFCSKFSHLCGKVTDSMIRNSAVNYDHFLALPLLWKAVLYAIIPLVQLFLIQPIFQESHHPLTISLGGLLKAKPSFNGFQCSFKIIFVEKYISIYLWKILSQLFLFYFIFLYHLLSFVFIICPSNFNTFFPLSTSLFDFSSVHSSENPYSED